MKHVIFKFWIGKVREMVSMMYRGGNNMENESCYIVRALARKCTIYQQIMGI